MNQNPYNFNNQQQNGVYYQPQPQFAQPQFTTAQQQQYLLQQQQITRARAKEKTELLTAGFAFGTALVCSLILQVIGVTVLQAMGKYDLFQSSFMFQHAANIIIVDLVSLIVPFFVMSLFLKDRYITPVVPLKKVGFLKGASWVAIGLAICLGANVLTNFVIELFKQFGYELTQYDSLKPNHPLECVLLVFSTAVAPAICEEFAMRCTALGALRKHGKAFAVVAVSIVFGLLHGNVIQFVFAFTIGLILGYVTIVTDSVLPAMFIHGFNNGLSVVQDIVKYAADKDASTTVTAVLMVVILVLAVLGLIYLITKKELLPKREQTQQNPYKVNFFAKLGLLMPGLIVPFIILIVLTAKTIKPI